jgi:hypothetical protein
MGYKNVMYLTKRCAFFVVYKYGLSHKYLMGKIGVKNMPTQYWLKFNDICNFLQLIFQFSLSIKIM